jgi:hypothetical protein
MILLIGVLLYPLETVKVKMIMLIGGIDNSFSTFIGCMEYLWKESFFAFYPGVTIFMVWCLAEEKLDKILTQDRIYSALSIWKYSASSMLRRKKD